MPARAQHAERLGEEACPVVVEMRRLDVQHDVERSVRELEPLGVADPELEPRLEGAAAREAHVLAAQVDADKPARPVGSSDEARAAAAAAADLEHVGRRERRAAQRVLVEPQTVELGLVAG
jgi:hypothetical protein